MLQTLTQSPASNQGNSSVGTAKAFPGDDSCGDITPCPASPAAIRITASSDITVAGAAVYGNPAFLPEANVS